MLTLLFHSHSLKLGRIGDDSESVGVRACTGLQCGPIVFIKSRKVQKVPETGLCLYVSRLLEL